MSRSRRGTLDYFDDLMMSSDDISRQRHLRLGSESTVSSGGEPWDDSHYIKCQQQCQTSGFRSSRRPEVHHESFGNNPLQIEDDTSGMGSVSGSGSGSGSGSYRKHFGSYSHKGSIRSQTKPPQEYIGSCQGSGWGYSLASPERFKTTAAVREQRRHRGPDQTGDPYPNEDPEPLVWSQESHGGEAGNTVESISLRINKAYQHTATATNAPISPFSTHQGNEYQQPMQPRLDPFSLHNNRPYQQPHMDLSAPETIYRSRQKGESRGDGVSSKEATVVKNNELFEYSLMPRIMPNSGEDQIEEFHRACLDSQPQSNCRTSLTLNSWLGETIDPTFTMESFTLSAKDNARLSSGSIEFDVTDQRPRVAASEVASMGSLESWDNEDMFKVSKSEKKSAGIKQMGRCFDMEDVRPHTSRSASEFKSAAAPPEPPNDCTITCRPKTSKKKMVKALRSFICGRVGKRSLEKSWTDRDLKDLVAAQSGTAAVRPPRSPLDRGRVVDSFSREDPESSQDSEILDTPRGHRGERFFIPEGNSSKRPVQIVSKAASPKSNPRITEINWKELEPPSFQLSDGEWAKYWRFNGYWKLDREMSDIQNVWQVSGPLQKASNKVDSLVIDSTPRVCRMAFLSDAVQLQEQMPWGGEIVNCKRRDCRMGYMLAWVERTRKGFITRMDWGDPYPANLAESFELSKDGQLLFSIQEVERRDKPEVRSRTRSVFRRQG